MWNIYTLANMTTETDMIEELIIMFLKEILKCACSLIDSENRTITDTYCESR